MGDDPSVAALVARARMGDQHAWARLVERYAQLLWSICRRYGLSHPDAADVCQRVWTVLVEQLPALREPAALPGWLVTTTRRECLRLLRAERQHAALDTAIEPGVEPAAGDEAAVDRELLAAEREAALRAAFAQLKERCRRLLAMLAQDPPVPYAEISARLHMRIGSIGPTRARCLEDLRRSPPLAALIAAEAKGS
jgi:RNA polymerase sigma factor (sigma-70 family)